MKFVIRVDEMERVREALKKTTISYTAWPMDEKTWIVATEGYAIHRECEVIQRAIERRPDDGQEAIRIS